MTLLSDRSLIDQGLALQAASIGKNALGAEHQKALLRDWDRYVAWTREFIRKGQGEDVLGMVRQEMADWEDEQDEKRLREVSEREGKHG